MAAYRADIEIGVVGVGKLGALHKSLNQLANAVDIINSKQIGKGLNVQNLATYNAQLERASNLLSKVAAGIPEETAAINTYVTALLQSNAARERQNTLIQQEIALRSQAARIAALPTPVVTPSQYAQPAGPVAAPGTGLAAAMQTAGMPTFAAGVRGIGQGLTPGNRGGTIKSAVGSAIIGGGFPLLFGQGPEAAVGGAVGGALGGLIGGPMGFALSIAGTAIGELLAKQKELTEEVRNEAIARGQVGAAVNQQLANAEKLLSTQKTLQGLDLQIAEASAAGNEQLQIELQYQKELEQINSDRLEAIRQAAQDQNTASGEQFKRAMDVANAEAENSRHVAERVKQLQLATAEYQAQVTEIRHQTQLAQSNIEIEKQRVSMAASYIEARSQAEIAVNNVLLQRLEYELQGAQTQQERIQIAQQIYQIEVANATATYQATVARINAQTQLVALAIQEQQQKALSLEVEKALALQKNQDVRQLERAIELQARAVQLARENLFYSQAIANEQIRGADATFRAAEQAARLKFETNAAAKEAAAYAESMEAAASAVNTQAAATAAATPVSGARLESEPFLTTIKRFEQALQKYDEVKSYGLPGAYMPKIEDFLPGGSQSMGYVPPGYRQPGRTIKNIYGEPVSVSREFYDTLQRALQVALEKYQTNRAGESTEFGNPQVSITTGPVMQMDGTNYVTQRDLMTATQSAARQGASMALGQLERDPATRRRVGVMR